MSGHRDSPILLVEGDRPRAGALTEQLLADGYPVELALNREHARVLAAGNPPALVVLGAVEPPRGALLLLEEIRASDPAGEPWDRDLPAVVLGHEAGELDALRAFEAGADDFVPTPAGYLLLRARLRAVMRRCRRPPESERPITIGALELNTGARSARVSGSRIPLRRQEFELLAHLASDPQRVFARQELLRQVWGYRARGSSRTVDTHACRLRHKLNLSGDCRFVINVRGVGYRLI
jgi:DNA-binding response OmpR family regulator